MTRLNEPTTEADAPDAGANAENVVEELHLVYTGRSVQPVATFALGGDVLVIGRGADVDIPLEDAKVSRSHARVVWDARARSHRFSDLGSANGTFLNGRRLETGLLSRNDVLRIGTSLFVYGTRAAMRQLERDTLRLASSQLSVLIFGETGSGKEVLARRLHDESARSGTFVAVNCAALPRNLAEAELFGHTRNAFSGAVEARGGLVRAAHGGTLFLDEIGDLPRELQPVLLRTLQERTIRPVGSDRELNVDVRVVAATHADLEERARDESFRPDLLARLRQVVLTVPPLRQRRAELLGLAREFAPTLAFSPEAAEAMLLGSWRRNVRELKAALDAFVVLEPEAAEVTYASLVRHVPELAVAAAPSEHALLEEPAPANRRSELTSLLEKHGGNVSAVARELRKPRSHVYRWLHALGIRHR